MQSAPSGSRRSLGLGGPSDLTAKRKSLHRTSSQPRTPPTRIVVAEGGSEFVLETPPQRPSASTSSQAVTRTGIASEQLRATSASHAPTWTQSSAAPCTLSTSLTPPRSKPVDRPYRPPPSSSARFYERQQQLWQLQHAAPGEPSNQLYMPSSSYLPSIPGVRHSPTEPAISSNSLSSHLLQPGPSNQHHARYTESVPHSNQAWSAAASSVSSRTRSYSIGGVGASDDSIYQTRARAGSDASSFTRSRISNGYMSQTDEESHDEPTRRTGPTYSFLDAPFTRTEPPSRRVPLAVAPTLSDLGDTNDVDWDTELGISADSPTDPLRLPLPPLSHRLALAPADVDTHTPAPDHETVNSQIVVSSVAAPMTSDSSLKSPLSVDLKGIRVTSNVSENWDDDFLFQNDEDPAEDANKRNTTRSSADAARVSGSGARDKPALHRVTQDHPESDDDEDVENWDDAFAWNAEPSLTPSSSNSSSIANLRQYPALALALTGTSSQILRGNATSSSEAPTKGPAKPQKRWSDSSSASDVTNLSLRLAAQSDVDSFDSRASCDSGRHHASASQPKATRPSALKLASTPRSANLDLNHGSDASGDDTETETPSRDLDSSLISPVSRQSRPARRSLGAALGFKTQVRPPTREADVKSPITPHTADEDSFDSTAIKAHKRTSSRPKLGALQRLSLSRSRVSVADTGNASIDDIPSAIQPAQHMYMDAANLSQASLISQKSASSARSSRSASVSSLAKSYAAMRSSSFRRLLGRGTPNKSATLAESEAVLPPPASPSRFKSENRMQSELQAESPADRPIGSAESKAKSPPSNWLGMRRSSEVTPTRPRVRDVRRSSDGRDPTSPGRTSEAAHSNLASRPSSSRHARPIVPDAGQAAQTRTSSDASYAGLHRDFSSSNTLRADSGQHDAQPLLAFVEPWARADATGGASSRTSAAASDGSATFLYSKQGESMSRGIGDSASASRSVSASTAYSHTSAESLYGYRMKSQVSASSGADAPDSETSYGTSVGSSPGLSQLSSSGWLSHAKYGTVASADTRTTSWSQSHDRYHFSHGKEDDDSSCAVSSVQASPGSLTKTLEGTPPRAARGTRLLSAPDTDTSPPVRAASWSTDTSLGKSAITPSHTAASRGVQQVSTAQAASSADGSAAISPTESAAFSTVGSTRPRNAARRNSLSDLKIPSRISKAQTGIRNNINLVRDFAKGIEELKALKTSYLDRREHSAPMALGAEDGVQNWLECADVLIDLGQGRSDADSAAHVDTLTHTPLSVRVDSRRTTFSDASSFLGPRSPLEDSGSRKSSISGASGYRSTSGASQAALSMASSADAGRNVDVQREIDILSAILGGTKIASPPRVEARSHGRFKSETYARSGHGHPSNQGSGKAAATAPSADLKTGRSDSAPQDEDERNQRGLKDDGSQRPKTQMFNTAPASSDPNSSLELGLNLDGVDVGDANRSAKRRIRSASRAGLQGLRELLKVFKNAGPIEGVSTPPSKLEAVSLADESNGEALQSIVASAGTPTTTKQKRRSLTLKRRSFLRSKPSLEVIRAKSDVGGEADEAPPMPSGADGAHVGCSTAQEQSPSRRDTRSNAASSTTTAITTSSSKASRRVSLQSSRSTTQRRSVDGVQTGQSGSRPPSALRHRSDSKSAKRGEGGVTGQDRPGATKLRPPDDVGQTVDPRRASTSVDAGPQRPEQPVRSHSALESPTFATPMVPKLALRPEAMPGLLVYVQATKQHLQAAIDQLGPPISSDR
ncbi:uncharacterized protein PAN0_004d2396 [Moesziomyces antarcticus]|uniref:Uncharacterized protein n=2 Tax=Pseudozyma antarctica TaxID=84753 RepID=A0A081CBZ0_PSEA2|nr:uncharacterized protein PAN0_004d2396 [Moesziomyces antarcticus]GAK64186.1 conserved hypothetical protein [Moesziomyces antarcticus]